LDQGIVRSGPPPAKIRTIATSLNNFAKDIEARIKVARPKGRKRPDPD